MPSQDELLGQNIDNHYYIEELIGRGGMADVYRAYDTRLDRAVAIKIMHKTLEEVDPSFAVRFEREAKSSARLSSPNIVDIYDYGKHGDYYYIVMELLEGKDLKELLQENGPLPTDYLAQCAAQVCNALACAHECDIIHRDVKPQNIMIVDGGMVKLMDFGIARPQASELTIQDQVLGTAYYVSPEQATGKPLTGASDIYSLGCVLYECTTGRIPFDGKTPVDIAVRQVYDMAQPVELIIPDIDSVFVAIVNKCMAKNPQDRFPDAATLGKVLSDYAAGLPVNIDPSGATTSVLPRQAATTQVMNGLQQAQNFADDEDDDDDDGDTKSSKKKITVIICIIAAILVAIIVTTILLTSGSNVKIAEENVEENVVEEVITVEVPDFVGMTEAEARSAAQEAGLSIKISNENSGTVEAGIVMGQDPSEGTMVVEGSTVTLTISAGEGALEIPNIVGMTEAEAYAALSAAGFESGTVTYQTSNSVEEGVVISQGVTGIAQRGTQVPFVVSSGPEMLSIPYVVGFTLSEAYSALSDFNVVVSGSTNANSIVISQDTGSRVAGDTVNITTEDQSSSGGNTEGNTSTDNTSESISGSSSNITSNATS